MPQITYFELEAMPTLSVGQAADLKIDTGTIRVWVSRCHVSDVETQPVQAERLIDGRWVDVTETSRGPGYSHDIDLDGPYQGLSVHLINRLLRTP